MSETQAKPQRSARLIFTQTVLALQGIAALFAAIVSLGLGKAGMLGGWVDVAPQALVIGGLVLMVLLLAASGVQQRSWGRWLGWALQAPMIAAGVAVPAIGVIGLMFLALWITALRLGGRIDRERAERADAEEAAAEGRDV